MLTRAPPAQLPTAIPTRSPMLKLGEAVSKATGGDSGSLLSVVGANASLEVGPDEEAPDVRTLVELVELVEASLVLDEDVIEIGSLVEFMESTLLPETSIVNPRLSLQHAFESSTPLRRYPQQ